MPRLLAKFRLDTGWRYVVAGLALCGAGLLVPTRRDLDDLRRQRDRLVDEKAVAEERLDAYQTFLGLLDEDDPALLRRLAAAQLNLVPADDTPVLMAASRTATVTEWIDENVRAAGTAAAPARETLLTRLVSGQRQLWVLAGGVVVVFMGLLLDEVRSPTRRRPKPVVPSWPAAPRPRRRPAKPGDDFF
ncbi:MAG: hypothetical protein ACYSU7_20135, partial [Planctomycetota bacterium]